MRMVVVWLVSCELRLTLLLSGADDAEAWPEDENTKAEGMIVKRLVAVGVVCGVEVLTVFVDKEGEEIRDASDGDDVEDWDAIDVEYDEADVEVTADTELGLEIPTVVGKKSLFFEAQQSCEVSAPQHQLPSSSHNEIWLSEAGLSPFCPSNEP